MLYLIFLDKIDMVIICIEIRNTFSHIIKLIHLKLRIYLLVALLKVLTSI